MTIITSKANQVVKNTKKLLQKKYRKDSYLIEGWHLFEEAVKADAEIKRIFVLEAYKERVEDFSQTIVVSPEILADLSDSKTPQGIVAEIALGKQLFPQELRGKYLFLEDVQDPGNVGTIIRTADAAGFSGVFLSKHSADLYNLKTLRSMQGSHFHLPIYRIDSQDILDLAKQSQLPILATTLTHDSVDYKSLAEEEFLLVMGNEGQGISSIVKERADQLVHIPMKGQAESLNVAVAAGILIFTLS
ncbi:TrmH family RNA methyltransferase [Streptococcus himalayensis]|uniref:rRNA methyltransferase n=1 Tax=Streptococcus himalayensis TaxID=1888195 RepID=A0A917ABW3_9STRE|nr:RNA methyltransferase [Streptococcus himalayensis]GGE37464.1 rRNA methyltransferase [Streptococcus himalayensis]